MADNDKISLPLGNRLPPSPYYQGDVIGAVEQSISGNTIIRVGKLQNLWGTERWEQQNYLVLTPEERAHLIELLVAQERAEDDARADAEQQESIRQHEEELRARDEDGELQEPVDPYYDYDSEGNRLG